MGLEEKLEKIVDKLGTKIDAQNETLSGKLDSQNETLSGFRLESSKDFATLGANQKTHERQLTELFIKADDHTQRVSKVEEKALNTESDLKRTEDDLKRHVDNRLVHNGSSSHLPSQENGGLSQKQKAAIALGGGSVAGGGAIYGVIEFLKWLSTNVQ